MDLKQITSFARMMTDAHGEQAEAAAARRQADEEKNGNSAEVENWKKIRAAIAEIWAPHSS
jgi:hypothetical protein